MPNTASDKPRRKRCQNCNKYFVPRKNVGKRARFCKKDCCDEFHRHGSAFGPMKMGLYAAIDKKYAALEREIVNNRLRSIVDVLARLEVRIVKLEKLVQGLANHTHACHSFSYDGQDHTETGQPKV